MMVIILASWYVLKHTLAARRRDPQRRGVYERLFYDLSAEHPHLWSRGGAREVALRGLLVRLKWRLIKLWYAPSRTVRAHSRDPDTDELGAWARVKRALVRRWLAEIDEKSSRGAAEAELGEGGMEDKFGAVTELLSLSTPVALADGEPAAARLTTPPFRVLRTRAPSPSGSDRPLSAASSGVMVVEEDKSSDDEGSDHGRSSSPGIMQRLGVPPTSGQAGERAAEVER